MARTSPHGIDSGLRFYVQAVQGLYLSTIGSLIILKIVEDEDGDKDDNEQGDEVAHD